jgi:ABC-type transport system involved in multi-copper enzyme maturation permease subunit
MTWLTWRQFRIQAVSVYGALAAICVVLAITGPDLVGRTNFTDMNFMFGGTAIVLYLLPLVVGVFWGVPMVTREVETGTHNLAWNQTITRKRWLATKLGLGVLAAMVAAGLLSLAVSWWASPIDALASQDAESAMLTRMSPVMFGARGIAPIGYAAFAFVLGVAVGIVFRRTVAAMAVTLVLFVAVMVAVPVLVRPYMMPAVQETVSITSSNVRSISGDPEVGARSLAVEEPVGAWVLTNETVDSAGNAVSPLPDIVQNCLPRPGQGPPPERGNVVDCMAKLSPAGYRQHLAYQPGDHFWPLQWIETAMFLALSALLAWFCFRRLRHLS